ncbi:hypothetical protein U9R90_05370 [Streptomyces sp. E11-3]|uniref:hypothetical protein n=1 Tax=Streptomyces sp. E11-3 TaxID=3110112 RepID=UPI00398169C6
MDDLIARIVGALWPLIYLTAAITLPVLLALDSQRNPMTTPCRSCRAPKPPRMYLCGNCWGALPTPARRALSRHDSKAFARLRELHRQLDADVPVAEVQVTP